MIDPSLVNERITAVDIGNSGGIVANTHTGMDTWNMPSDPKILWAIFKFAKPEIVVAEDVHTFAGQGLVSSGTLMKNKGILIGVASSFGLDVEFIEPMAWIKCYTLKRSTHFEKKKQWKEHLMSKANEIRGDKYPLNLQTTDAFLIWNYRASISIGKPLKSLGINI